MQGSSDINVMIYNNTTVKVIQHKYFFIQLNKKLIPSVSFEKRIFFGCVLRPQLPFSNKAFNDDDHILRETLIKCLFRLN